MLDRTGIGCYDHYDIRAKYSELHEVIKYEIVYKGQIRAAGFDRFGYAQ